MQRHPVATWKSKDPKMLPSIIYEQQEEISDDRLLLFIMK